MPRDFDRLMKENILPLELPLIKKLLNLVPPRLEPIDPKLQATLEVEMDSIRRVVHDDPALDYGLQIEFHVKDEDFRARNFLYYALFYKNYGLPLRQIVVYLGNQTPKYVTRNVLELTGERLEFEVIVLKQVPKERFLNSDVPEEVILALLCDFGQDQPVEVVRQIIRHLHKIVRRPQHLKKHQQQLVILSRLRKLYSITKPEIDVMQKFLDYDVESDELYLEGIEKGIALRDRQIIRRLWDSGEYDIPAIARLMGLSEERIRQVIFGENPN